MITLSFVGLIWLFSYGQVTGYHQNFDLVGWLWLLLISPFGQLLCGCSHHKHNLVGYIVMVKNFSPSGHRGYNLAIAVVITSPS